MTTENDADDERRARYGEAIGWRDDGSTPGAIHAMLREQTARVMAVADAEQAELRSEVERLQAAQARRSGTLHDANNAVRDLRRALADERAKVARAEMVRDAIAEQCQHDEQGIICEAHQADLYEGTCALLLDVNAALAGPEPEATEAVKDAPKP